MSSGDGQRTISVSEALTEWLDENERYDQRRKLNEAARSAFRASSETIRTSPTLRAVTREHAASEFQRSGDAARCVVDTLTRLLVIHDDKLAELGHLVAQVGRAEPLLREAGDHAISPEAATLQKQVGWDESSARQRIQALVGDLVAFELDVAQALGASKALERVRGLVNEYENDGLVPDPPPQLRGNVKRRMQECVYQAFDCSIVLVEMVYNDCALLQLSAADFASETRRRLNTLRFPSMLTLCAMLIDAVRRRRDPEALQYEHAECEEHLLRHLQDKHFSKRLQPLGRAGGEGSGPKVACFHLIADLTGLSWTTVRDYVAHCEGEREKRFGPVNADGATQSSVAEDRTRKVDWEAMSVREFLKNWRELGAEVARRISSPTTPPEQVAELQALLDKHGSPLTLY